MKTRALLALLLAAGIANAAPTKTECIAAFDRAQREKRGGHLHQARENLVVCSQTECPAVIRADCAGVLRQVEAAQPTIVLHAADKKGADLTDVEVVLDGRTIATSLDGRAIEVDPGKLQLEFQRPPWDPVTVEVVVAEGEKDRIVRAALGPEPPPPPPPPRVDVFVSTPPPKRNAVGWAVPAGFVVLSAASFAFAGISRITLGNDADTLRTRCAPTCDESEHQRLLDRLTVTNIALGVGIGSLALGTLAWFVLAPKEHR